MKLANEVMGLMADLDNARAISQNYKELLTYWKDGTLPDTQQPPKKRGVVVRLVQK